MDTRTRSFVVDSAASDSIDRRSYADRILASASHRNYSQALCETFARFEKCLARAAPKLPPGHWQKICQALDGLRIEAWAVDGIDKLIETSLIERGIVADKIAAMKIVKVVAALDYAGKCAVVDTVERALAARAKGEPFALFEPVTAA